MPLPRRKGFLNPGQSDIDAQNRVDNPEGWGYTPPPVQGGPGAGGAAAVPGVAYGGSSADIIGRLQANPGDPNQALYEMIGRGLGISDENERRRTQTLGYLGREQEMASKPTLTDEDSRRFASRESDRITAGSQAEQRDIMSFLGSAGIFGGQLPASMLAANEMGRMGQVLGTRRDIRLQKAQTDALDRAGRWTRSQGIGQLMNEPSDMVGLDTLTSVADLRTQMALGDKAVQAARETGRSTERAGKSSGIGSAIGGILGGF